MIEFMTNYGLFFAKTITLVVALLIAVGSLISLAMRQKKPADKHLEVTHLNRQYEEMESTLNAITLSEAGMKLRVKADKKKAKEQAKSEKKSSKASKLASDKNGNSEGEETPKKRLFVLDFEGDLKASSVETMREEISALLTIATENDEVLVRLESGGGAVHGYGLGASQLQRIKQNNIPLTVSVDKIAASGGYLMACVANKIIAAPFAFLGSIGVLAEFPNLHRLLQKNDIDYEQLYAGEFKRTLTMFGENTDKRREKMQKDLEETHLIFKDYVKSQRPDIDIEKVSTGEHWLGTRALELGLIDQLQTSDDYLMNMRGDADIIHLEYIEKEKLMHKLTNLMSMRFQNPQKYLSELEKPLLM